MTKKDYETITEAIAEAITKAHTHKALYGTPFDVWQAFNTVIGKLSDALYRDNDRFDEQKFLDAIYDRPIDEGSKTAVFDIMNSTDL